MNNITEKLLTLTLNSSWQPVGQKIVKDALCDFFDGSGYSALDIDYDIDENGEYDFSSPLYMNPVNWDEWVKLPVRSFDFSVRSAKMTIRVPTILIAKNFAKMPMKKPKLSKFSIRSRDKNTCQYTGKKLNSREGNIDHVVPLSRGGKDEWKNMVYCSKDVNTKKQNKTPEEAGLNLIRQPREPGAKPLMAFITQARHPDWQHFLLA